MLQFSGVIHSIKFQSAPPVKGAMIAEVIDLTTHEVSIRAPREGGDEPHRRSLP